MGGAGDAAEEEEVAGAEVASAEIGALKRELVLIRHAETEPDWNLPPEAWRLSPRGEQQAEDLANAEFWSRLTVLVSSDEPKALSTARPAVLRHRLALESLRELREVQRPAVRIPDYPAAVRTYLRGGSRDREQPNGWEPRAAAEERVWRAIAGLLERCSEPTVAVVSHGLLLTLYSVRLLRLDDPFAFWNDIPFGGYARVDPTSGILLEGFINSRSLPGVKPGR